MLRFVIEHGGKAAQIRTATAAMVTGTPIGDGNFVADRDIQYDGLNAAFTPKAKDNDKIAIDDLYTEVPVMKGERIAVDESLVTGAGAMNIGDSVKVESGKYVAGSATDPFVFRGEYTTHNFGVKMYALDRVLP